MAGAVCPLTALDDAQALLMLLMLGPRDAVTLQATSKDGVLAKAAASRGVWQAHSERIFGLSGDLALQGPSGSGSPNTTASAAAGYPAASPPAQEAGCGLANKAAFGLWHAAANEVNLKQAQDDSALLPLPAAWVAAWQKVFRWTKREVCRDLAEHLRLRSPASPSVLAELEQHGYKMAPEVLGMWRVCDGQGCAFHPQLAPQVDLPALGHDDRWMNGLFGGYAVYDHAVSMMLLPLGSALKMTLFFKERTGDMLGKSTLIFAASHGVDKMFLVDVVTGEVSHWSPQQRTRTMERIAPELEAQPRTGLLRWFQEHARRLDEDYYPILPLRPESGPSTTGLCLCPRALPPGTCCVTRGVEVSASCVYMPEHPQGYTYSISLRLVGTAAERGFETCQLSTRTWQIQEDGRPAEQVHGDGVIGFFPILTDGGWLLNKESDPHGQYGTELGLQPGAFRYQSCSGRTASMKGSFGGLLNFVPGTTKKPKDKPFAAKLEAFRLVVPEFIY